jgi:uncharacterized membrane protein YhaH (DUF805 family)
LATRALRASFAVVHAAPYTLSSLDSTAAADDEPLSPSQVLFSLRGRIPRKTWWAYGVLGLTLFGAHAYMLLTIAGMRPANSEMLVNVLVFWPALALLVKRWHDRGKTGWWVLLNLVPVLGFVWTFVECGLLRGSVGANRYGDDPTGKL